MTITTFKRKNSIGLMLFSLGFLLLLSLATYTATDPCFSVTGAGTPIGNANGIIGAYLSDVLLQLVGVSAYFFPCFFFAYALFHVLAGNAFHPHLTKVGGVLLITSVSAFFGLKGSTLWLFGEKVPSGGMLGGSISYLLLSGFSSTSAYVITLITIMLALWLLTPHRRAIPHVLPAIVEEPIKPVVQTRKQKPKKPVQPVQETFLRPDSETPYQLPTIDLLDPLPGQKVSKVSKEEIIAESERLLQKLLDFDVKGSISQVYHGPVFTTFEFEPALGVKLSRIVHQANDLAIALNVESVRVFSLPGKIAFGIEVPNKTRETVYLRQIFETAEYQADKSRLKLPLGKDIFGAPVIVSIDKLPHLLIAGDSGSGKSVTIDTIIMSLLYNAKPNEVKLALIDPRMLELSMYAGIPHLISPVATEPKKAAETLKAIVAEMDRRYRQLFEKGSNNIESYNKDAHDAERLPYIVVIIDEFADLMATVAHEIEDSILRLTSMAQDVGIHLIMVTQRPTVDVIKGSIKANFTSRISFQVASKIDSHSILDTNGAENLLGMGDMLFHPPNLSQLIRAQGCYVSEAEIHRVVDFVKKQARPEYDMLQQRVKEIAQTAQNAPEEGERDEFYQRAVELVQENGQASTSFIQRRLRVGYDRAMRMIELMVEDDIVGPADGSNTHEVFRRGWQIRADGSYYIDRKGRKGTNMLCPACQKPLSMNYVHNEYDKQHNIKSFYGNCDACGVALTMIND